MSCRPSNFHAVNKESTTNYQCTLKKDYFQVPTLHIIFPLFYQKKKPPQFIDHLHMYEYIDFIT